MKDKEEILTAKIFLIKEGWKEDSSGMFGLNGLSELLEEYKNQFIQPQSPTLLCIEEKVIDEMIEGFKKHIDLSKKSGNQHFIDIGEYKISALNALKSKMKPIADVKSEAWDAGVLSCCEHGMVHTNCDKYIQQDKTKYINGE